MNAPNVLKRTQSYQKNDWASLKDSQNIFKVSLRQNKRIIYLNKRRSFIISDSEGNTDNELNFLEFIPEMLQIQYPVLSSRSDTEILKIIDNWLLINDNAVLSEVLSAIWTISNASSTHITSLIQSNIPKTLINLLNTEYPNNITEKSIKILSNLAYEDTYKVYIDSNFILKLLGFVESSHQKIAENAMRGLANVSADSEAYRKILLENNYVNLLMSVLDLENLQMCRIIAWSVSNITQEAESLSIQNISTCVSILSSLFQIQDDETILEVLWTLVNLSSISSIVQTLIDKNLIYTTVQILALNSSTGKVPALKTIGNICASTYEHTQYILNLSILDIICKDIYVNTSLSNDTFWLISNIAAGTPNQVKKLVESNIFQHVVISLVHYELSARTQVARALKNLLKACPEYSAKKIIDMDVYSILAIALKDKDPDFCLQVLDICELLCIGPNKLLIEETGCLHSLEKLLKHSNPEIYKKTENILNNIF
jgi:hypothetical protein